MLFTLIMNKLARLRHYQYHTRPEFGWLEVRQYSPDTARTDAYSCICVHMYTINNFKNSIHIPKMTKICIPVDYVYILHLHTIMVRVHAESATLQHRAAARVTRGRVTARGTYTMLASFVACCVPRDDTQRLLLGRSSCFHHRRR